MIRGLNRELDVAIARDRVQMLFRERFPTVRIVSVNVLRESYPGGRESIGEVKRKLDSCIAKLKECQWTNNLATHDRERPKKLVPRFRYFPLIFTKQIDAEDHYLRKKVILSHKFKEMQNHKSKRNAGIAFVSL